MFKKDVRMLGVGWLVILGVLLIVVVAVTTANYFGFIPPGIATAIGVILLVSNIFIFPANLFKGLNKEMKRTPSLWLQTPQSGWSMFISKIVSSLLGAVMFLVLSDCLAWALFHIDAGNALSEVQRQVQANANALTSEQLHIAAMVIAQIPRLVFYTSVSLLCVGIYIAMWVSLVYMSVRAVRYRLHKFSWIVGMIVVLIATWGLGAVEHTALYQHVFGWGKFSALALFPANVQSVIPAPAVHTMAPITTGYVVFDTIIMIILFYLVGRIIDRHVEV